MSRVLVLAPLLVIAACARRGAIDLDQPVGMSTVGAPGAAANAPPAAPDAAVRRPEGAGEVLECPEELPSFVFDTNSAVIDPRQAFDLARLAQCLTLGPFAGSTLIAIGHADAIGGTAENVVLGLERATKIRDVLIAQGVDATRVLATTTGERMTAAAVPGRRVDLVLTSSPPFRTER